MRSSCCWRFIPLVLLFCAASAHGVPTMGPTGNYYEYVQGGYTFSQALSAGLAGLVALARRRRMALKS